MLRPDRVGPILRHMCWSVTGSIALVSRRGGFKGLYRLLQWLQLVGNIQLDNKSVTRLFDLLPPEVGDYVDRPAQRIRRLAVGAARHWYASL